MKIIRPITPGRAHPEVRKHFMRNYVGHCLDGGLFFAGVRFVAPETVAPEMAKSLGAPDWIIPFMPMMLFLGASSTPLLTAHIVERFKKMMPIVVINGFFQRAPFLIAAILLYFCYESVPWLAISAAVLAPFFVGAIGGFASGAWMELVSRMIPPQRRSSSFAIRSIISSASALGVGAIVSVVLTAYPDYRGYALLYFLGWIGLMLSWSCFFFMKEPLVQRPEKVDRPTFIKTLKVFPVAWRTNERFRYFFLARATGAGFFIFLYLLATNAVDISGKGAAFLGKLIIVQTIGGFLGNFASAYLGDKHGARLVMMIARCCFIIVAALSIAATSIWEFYIIFAVLGVAWEFNMASQMTLTMEVAPNDSRPTYVALLATLSAPFMLAAGLLGSALEGLDTPLWMPAALGIIAMTASLYFLYKMTDPRADAIAESEAGQ